MARLMTARTASLVISGQFPESIKVMVHSLLENSGLARGADFGTLAFWEVRRSGEAG